MAVEFLDEKKLAPYFPNISDVEINLILCYLELEGNRVARLGKGENLYLLFGDEDETSHFCEVTALNCIETATSAATDYLTYLEEKIWSYKKNSRDYDATKKTIQRVKGDLVTLNNLDGKIRKSA